MPVGRIATFSTVFDKPNRQKAADLWRRFCALTEPKSPPGAPRWPTDRQSGVAGGFLILARWGEVLDEWPLLCKKAADKHREIIRAELLDIKQKVATRLANLADETMATMAGGRGKPGYYD
ncbi:hypothetical protein CMI37_14320 [Candidatus Pacearchaeota archaeon]|nr:hypothetical protein [Candidatus Pacearchaeota archaeon]